MDIEYFSQYKVLGLTNHYDHHCGENHWTGCVLITMFSSGSSDESHSMTIFYTFCRYRFYILHMLYSPKTHQPGA